MPLTGSKIVVGVGGGIAAFKAVELVRELGRRGASVRVVMTPSATHFVGPTTFAGLTGKPAITDLWDPGYAGEVHVELGAWADAIVVAPATANLLARAAHGFADDAVLATLSCARGAIVFAPAMHERMWRRPATQRNVTQLADDGARFVGPIDGPLASGDVGEGRMAEPDAIADAVERVVGRVDLGGLSIVVTAGPTVEDLDPVRFLGNRSTGRMGFAVAARAAARGADVVLVCGPVELPAPPGVERVDVRSAVQMQRAVASRATDADVVVMAAAVADYRPAEQAEHKLRKTDGPMTLTLVRNPDILAELGAARTGDRPVLVGFSVETRDHVERARDKLRRKKVDLVIANDASVGFGGDENEATLVSESAEVPVPRGTKTDLADEILDAVRDLRERPR